jgi:hypothetical protein
MYLLEEGLELSANKTFFVPITILSCESAEMIQ